MAAYVLPAAVGATDSVKPGSGPDPFLQRCRIHPSTTHHESTQENPHETRSTAAAVLLLVVAASAPAHAQLTGSLNGLHDITVTNLKATADKVSADLYDFRPTDEVRTLGQILAHVANSQYAFCSAASGQDNPMSENLEETATTKAQITAALADAFAYCDAVYASMTDEQAAMTVSFFGGDMAVGGVLAFNSMHNYEHYGNLVTYMRINGSCRPRRRGTEGLRPKRPQGDHAHPVRTNVTRASTKAKRCQRLDVAPGCW